MNSPLLRNSAHNNIFNNQIFLTKVLYIYLLFVIIFLGNIGFFNSNFFNFGPSDTIFYFTIPINNWNKWSLLAVFMFINTIINVFATESIYPWITNTIQDHKNRYIPYNKITCIFICQTFYFYINAISIFSLFGSITQIDFLLIRIIADVIVSNYTTIQFLKNKIFDVEMYEEQINYFPESL